MTGAIAERARQIPTEELRLAVVLNGGVSLAVWMGGVTQELDALVRARVEGTDPYPAAYEPVLSLTRTRVAVDVISGTSAGGINGACLALSLANKRARLGTLRDLWAEQGRIDNLLRPPFRGQPTSLLQGDEYFLPELTKAMRGLVTDFEPTGAPLDLTITTTLLSGAVSLTTDALGQQLPQRRHGAHFHFSTETDGDRVDDFSAANVATTSEALGLASRCTAGFPFAFEPTFVPVESPSANPRDPATPHYRLAIDGRPNMWRWASWADDSRKAVETPDEPEDLSRYAVDGGVLANTPTREALAAIDRRKAGSPLRRVMLLVFPHAPGHRPGDPGDAPDAAADSPTVTRSAAGLLSSLTSQGSLTFVEEIDANNRRAALWRGGRRRVLEHYPLPQMYALVASGWRYYVETRVTAAARSLSERVSRPPGWDYLRVLDAAAEGQRSWMRGHWASLPYAPTYPVVDPGRTSGAGGDPWPTTSPAATGGWAWGTTVALGIADSVGEILLRAQGLTSTEDAGTFSDALDAITTQRNVMLDARDAFDQWWWHQPALTPVAPDEAYWKLRLDCYNLAMEGVPAPAGPTAPWSDSLAALRGLDGKPLGAAQRQAIEDVLERRAWLSLPTAAGATLGDQTYRAVQAVVHELAAAQDLVSGLATGTGDPGLGAWTALFDPAVLPGEPPGRTPSDVENRLLDRLLTLDAATWMLADTDSPGTSPTIKLAQLSLGIDHPWAAASITPDDKVAGSELNRFGGFLKQSWRINDWTWGRLDAVQMLCRLVLDPARLHRMYAAVGPTPAESAELVVGDLLDRSGLVDPALEDPRVVDMRRAAVAELTDLFGRTSVQGGHLPALAALAAYPIQQRVVVTELPVLAKAIRSDLVNGANERSRGAAFLSTEKELLATLDDGDPNHWRRHGIRALDAFDRAGVGREPLEDEARSDAMIQTAVTAAATLVTVADSERLGVGALGPATRAVRGAALLPYWLVTGLLSRSGIARAVGLVGFAVGGVALLLGVLGLLGGFSAAGTTLGAGVVVGAFGFAALRSGTMLHGLVLLGAAAPPVAAAAALLSGSDADPQSAGVSLAVVCLIALGLVVLASVPNPILSPAATVRAATARTYVAVACVVALAALAVAAATGRVPWPEDWRAWYDDVDVWPAAVASVAVVLVGAVSASLRGRGMRRWTQDGARRWHREPRVTAPAGVSAGWVAVYGTGYLVLAWAAAVWLTRQDGGHPLSEAQPWHLVTLTWWGLLGAVCCLAGPTWITWRARRRLTWRLRESNRAVPAAVSDEVFAAELERRSRLYSYLVGRGGPPALNRRGQALKPPVRHAG